MKKSGKTFWIIYLVWGLFNLTLLILAYSNVFGLVGLHTYRFYPINSLEIKYYDYAEFLVYAGIPLVVYLLYLYVDAHYYNDKCRG